MGSFWHYCYAYCLYPCTYLHDTTGRLLPQTKLLFSGMGNVGKVAGVAAIAYLVGLYGGAEKDTIQLKKIKKAAPKSLGQPLLLAINRF